jgi:hypothetical protein
MDAHLDALEAGTGFDEAVSAKADLAKLAVVGHSRGGPVAVRYISDEAAGHTALALALLTPAFLAPRPKIPADMPAALVIAECKKKDLLPANAQRDFAAAFVPDFLDAALAYGQLPVGAAEAAAAE